MYRILIFLSTVLFFGCAKNKETLNENIDKNNYDNFNLVFNKIYFFLNLITGEVENYKEKIIKIEMDSNDKVKIRKSFYKNHIDTIEGEQHIFNENIFTSIKKEDIIIIEKNNINQSLFYINESTQLESLKSPIKKNILLFYRDIKSILGKNKAYKDLYMKEKNKKNVLQL